MSSTTTTPTSDELTPSSGGILTDAAGNKWTLTSAGVVEENGTPVPDGSGTSAFAIVGNLYYGQDATSQNWLTYSPTTQSWTSSAAPVLVSTPTPTPIPTPSSSPTAGNWITQTIDGQQYEVLLPANYSSSQQYATILYLHPLDAGADPTSLTAEVNTWFNSTDFRTNYPAIIVMPLLNQTADTSGGTINFGGVTGDTPGTQFALDALKQVQTQYSVDRSRIYVTGASMGGQGTDQLMFDHGPNSTTPIFAAGYSMAGMMVNETPQQFVADIGSAPMEAVHGTADTVNPPGWDQAVAAIDPNFHLTQIQGAGHDVWDPQSGIAGYSSESNWSWLFQQHMPGTSSSKPIPTPTPSPSPTINELTPNSGATLTDANGNKWTLTAAGVVDENGTPVPDGSGTSAFAIVGNVYYGQDATSTAWYTYSPTSQSWSSSAAPVLTPTPTPAPPTPTPTPAPKEITPASGGTLTDSSGNKWTLTSAGVVDENGTPVPDGSGTSAFAIVGNVYYGQDATSTAWYTYSPTSQSWSSSAAPVLTPTPTPAPPTPTPTPAPKEITPASGGTLTDPSGNKWTLTSAGVVEENGTPVPDGSGTSAFAIIGNVYYGQDATSTAWYTYSPTSQSWSSSAAPALTSTSTSTPTPTPAPTTGTRDPSQTPFASNSIFNLPLGSGAQWTYNAQLANTNVVVNTSGNYNEPIYTSTASDPLVTVYNNGSAQGAAPETYQVHIPVGAEPSQPTPGDNIITIDDTSTHTWYSFGEFSYTSATTAVAGQGSAESDYGSGLAFDNSNQDEGVGTLRESDLRAGTIDHMLRINLPDDMLLSVSSNSSQLAANAWPQTAEDGFGPSAYTGTVPYGVTMGIPAASVEPSDVKANAGANMLWQALRDHGAMIRDSGGSGNDVTFQTDQNVNPNDPLIQGMQQYGSEIMAQVEILANQGPNSINGGGTPIVPLDPPPSDAPNNTVAVAQVSAATTSNSSMLFLGGSGASGTSSGGADASSGQTYVVPAAGHGAESFTSNILAMGDTLDLSTALAATNWNGSASTLSNYLKVTDSAQGATLSISATSGGSGVVIATIDGATTASLASLLAHSTT